MEGCPLKTRCEGGTEAGAVVGRQDGDALALEEDVLVQGVSRSVGLGEDFAARAVPVELAIGFGDATARAIIGLLPTRSFSWLNCAWCIER